MGRGRFGTFDLVVLAGLSPSSFIAGAEGATVRLGLTDTKTSIYVTDYSILHVFYICVYVCAPVE